MKAFLVIGLAVASAYARSDDGFSSVSRTEDALGNYQFNYDITDWDTNRKRWEVADAHNNRKGGYSITDVDGKVRQLEYVADKGGFRAVIRTNEPGTAPGYSGNALYVRDGVKQIITAAQPALQFTGHVIKQQKLAQNVIPATPVALPRPVIYQQPIVQPVIQPKPVVYQQPIVQPLVKQFAKPLVTPTVQVYQNVQPVAQPYHQQLPHQQHRQHYQLQQTTQYKPVLYQQPIVQHVIQPKAVVYQQPIVKPTVQYYQTSQPLVHVQPRPVVYHHQQQQQQQHHHHHQQLQTIQPVVQPAVHFQTYQHLQPVAVEQKFVAPAVKPVVQVHKVAVQPVVLREKKIIVTPPPAYSGPRRKVQKFVEDPAQSYITPELPQLSPKRIPGYNPGLEDFEDHDDNDGSTVAPPLSRSRVAYAPVAKFDGITRKSGSFPPLAGPPSRRARA